MNYILTKFKSLLPIGVKDFFYIGIIVILIILHINSCHNNHVINHDLSLPALTTGTNKLDANGVNHFTVPEKEVTKSQMKDATKDIKKNIGTSEVKSVTDLVTKINITTPEVPIELGLNNDSLKANYDIKDIHIKFSGDINTKKGIFQVNLVPDTLQLVRHTKKHWFKPDENLIDVTHTNGLFKDTLASSMSYKESKILFSIGPTMGVQINPITGIISPFIGVGITYSIFNIKRKN